MHPALRADLLPAAVGSQRRRSDGRAQLPAVGDKRSPTTHLHLLQGAPRARWLRTVTDLPDEEDIPLDLALRFESEAAS